ncbi:MAG: cytochrome c biogenesis protein CcsA [Armatimonadetes bacterium]|nr:cytochrome c biogenesis protein CcsA [Armatimonadota bacterium]
MTVVWSLLGWFSILGYLLVAVLVLLRLWKPQRQPLPLLNYISLITITCHLLYLVEGILVNRLRLDTPETLAVILGWLIAIGSLWQWWIRKIEAQLGILFPLSAILLTFGIFEEPTQLPPELRRDILVVHVTLMMVGYLMLMFSFGTAVVHLLTLWLLKNKRPLALLDKFPPLEVTEQLTSKLVLLGFPMLTLGMVVGVFWARLMGRSALDDPKVIFSILTGSIFAIYLHARFVRKWEAYILHWLIVVGFISLLVTFFAVRHTLATGEF